jgi:hypothetical protein
LLITKNASRPYVQVDEQMAKNFDDALQENVSHGQHELLNENQSQNVLIEACITIIEFVDEVENFYPLMYMKICH